MDAERKEFEVRGFDAVELRWIGDLIVTQGEGESLVVEGDPELVRHVRGRRRDADRAVAAADTALADLPWWRHRVRLLVADVLRTDSAVTGPIPLALMDRDAAPTKEAPGLMPHGREGFVALALAEPAEGRERWQ